MCFASLKFGTLGTVFPVHPPCFPHGALPAVAAIWPFLLWSCKQMNSGHNWIGVSISCVSLGMFGVSRGCWVEDYWQIRFRHGSIYGQNKLVVVTEAVSMPRRVARCYSHVGVPAKLVVYSKHKEVADFSPPWALPQWPPARCYKPFLLSVRSVQTL